VAEVSRVVDGCQVMSPTHLKTSRLARSVQELGYPHACG